MICRQTYNFLALDSMALPTLTAHGPDMNSPYPLPSEQGTSRLGSVLLQELHDAGVTLMTRKL